jgi:hypothetical protein
MRGALALALMLALPASFVAACPIVDTTQAVWPLVACP